MTPLQFVEALEALGISARYLGRVTGIPSGTIANWTRANSRDGFATPVPAAIADWLNILRHVVIIYVLSRHDMAHDVFAETRQPDLFFEN